MRFAKADFEETQQLVRAGDLSVFSEAEVREISRRSSQLRFDEGQYAAQHQHEARLHTTKEKGEIRQRGVAETRERLFWWSLEALATIETLGLARAGLTTVEARAAAAAAVPKGGPTGVNVKPGFSGPRAANASEAAAAERQLAPQLTGTTNKELLGEALDIVKKSPGGQQARADLFESLVPQIHEKGGGFVATRSIGTEGSEVFLGTTGQALVITPKGEIFLGSRLGGGVKFLPKTGKIQPVFENLRRVK